ncbi:LOW QUALITY PROTEIN: uncharacterized N-acetyltransferase p20-like [Phyllobates terribilis]|uniref:LOW QUALITY PROTEIN: uncharacterized N-acetyltransferase p20-like n=1 Tax=Phyllobates terribilis TaxID=111132 RepID=UPI003CCAFB84
MESHKISLRIMDLDDVDDMMVWSTDPKVAKFCRWDPQTSKIEAIDYMNTKIISHPYHWAICIDNTPVGAIMVAKNTGEDICRGELGYVLGSECWGKGIATVAVKLMAVMVFDDWPQLERLEAFVGVENKGSLRVLEKAGFTRDGVFRKYCIIKGKVSDMVIFSLLRSDPRPVVS